MSRKALVAVVILLGAIAAICMLFAVSVETQRPDRVGVAATKNDEREEDARQARAVEQAQRDRLADYARYKERREAEGSPVKNYDDWRRNDELFPPVLLCVLIPIIVLSVFIGYAATQDTWKRDYGGRDAARMIAMVRGSKPRRG